MARSLARRETAARPLRRFEPFRDFEELQDRMNQLVESAWSGGQVDDAPRPWVPSVDIEELDDAWIVEAELPGVDKRDVDVELRDSELTIAGEIKERERKGILRRRTRRTGRFEYRVTLPGPADPEGIDARLDDGILTVRVPKPEQARPRRIAVKSGAR
jgi:HSP20 family protein